MTAMKRYILMIIAAALLATSCENSVETIWSDQNEAMLVLNAQLMQDNPSHRVFVHCSEGGQNNEVTDAEVFYSVNGGPEKKVTPVTSWEEWYDGSLHEISDGYRFDEIFAAGDRVRLRASWHGLTATGEFAFPESAAKITAVDTARIVLGNNEGYYETHITRQYRITVKDAPKEKNYYMLRFQDVYYRLNPEGEKIASVTIDGSFDATDDHVLHPVENSMMEDLIGRDNYYETFTDEMFADGDYTIKVTDRSWAVYGSAWTEFWYQFEEGDSYCMDRRIKVYTLTFDEYIYLRAIDAAGNDLGFMTEPVIFPGNVSGGLGFVAGVTPEVWTLEFPAEPYTGEVPYNAYRYTDPIPEEPLYE
jgi:hypothetical protein